MCELLKWVCGLLTVGVVLFVGVVVSAMGQEPGDER